MAGSCLQGFDFLEQMSNSGFRTTYPYGDADYHGLHFAYPYHSH
jgi:hypothetical protein